VDVAGILASVDPDAGAALHIESRESAPLGNVLGGLSLA
jgi:hypothetical protein